ncbi:hypothetical protein NHQ30_011508 [Ciborinia camelliae]|nr:hypothetical protein NHQ30_011508 [Ciborinia camelliae]
MPTILITGASGFIGQLLATHLLTSHPTAPDNKLILTDITAPAIPPHIPNPQNVKSIAADLCEANTPSDLLSSIAVADTIFIFHGIMSSGSERNFALGMSVNLHGTLQLLEAMRKTKAQPPDRKPIRVIYASSLAVYGRPYPLGKIDENTHPTPEGSYGAQKLACETLIQDYIRRGYIDGLCLRFPTISIRPGSPTAAASSFLSGMIREPFAGRECVIPIRDRDFVSWMCSPRTLVTNLVWAMQMDLSRMDTHRRVVNLPGKATSVREMMDVLVAVGGEEKLRFLREVEVEEEDQQTVEILRSWGTRYDVGLALGLGFKEDPGFERAVKEFVEGMKSEG